MEKHYEGSNILFLEPGTTQSPRRFVLPFSTFMEDLTFGKILK